METLEQKKVYVHKQNTGSVSKTNVLHIIKSLGRGGAETLLAETLSLHDKEKFGFHYLYFFPWKDQMVKELAHSGGRVECMKASSNIRIFFKIRELARYIRENRIDVIHSHMPITGVVARIAGYITRVPVVYTEHNKWERYHRATYWLNKLTFGIQDIVVAVSAEVKASIAKHYSKTFPQVKVIANGVNTLKYQRLTQTSESVRKAFGIPAEATVIGTASVFRSQKRLTKWIEIAARLRKSNPQLYFIIVGDGVLSSEVHQKAAELNTGDYLFFAGLQPNVRPYLQAMDIFMMTSAFEGLPIALLEAMSMQCLPACTSAGGIGEVISHNENGILVPVDEPDRLVAEIQRYLDDPSAINQLKLNARATIKSSFEMTMMVDELEQIYSNLSRHS